MDETIVALLSLNNLIILVYGVRSRLSDLQNIHAREGRSAEIQRRIDEAQRYIDDIDSLVMRRSVDNPSEGWVLFDLMKTTHNGSVQRFSQRLKEALPARL